MPQAKRIKRKPINKPKVSKAGRRLPWGLMVVILVSGAVLGMLLNGVVEGDTKFGSGLKELFKSSQNELVIDQEIADLIEKKSTDKEFDFYDLLRDIDKVMPDDLPEATPTRVDQNLNYYLQAASFREHADAEKLRARLALQGYSSVSQAREVEGKGTFYRVRLDKRKAKTAKNKLQKLGVRPFIYTVRKS